MNPVSGTVSPPSASSITSSLCRYPFLLSYFYTFFFAEDTFFESISYLLVQIPEHLMLPGDNACEFNQEASEVLQVFLFFSFTGVLGCAYDLI